MNGKSTRTLLGPRGLLVVWVPLTLIAVIHYSAPSHLHWVHDVARRAFYVPIVMAGALGGVRWGLITALVTIGIYTPHAFFMHISADPATNVEKILETIFYLVLGTVAGVLAERMHREQARLTDLTDQLRRTVEEVKARDALLARTSRLESLGQLTAGLAHEIRNPLHAMRGTAEILLDAVPPDRDEHTLGSALIGEIDRLSGVLKRFLDFARPHEPALARVELDPILDRVASLVRAQASRQGAAIHVRHLPGSVALADQEQLVQVVLGIVINALQALDGSGRIVLAVERRQVDGVSWCGLRMENDGPAVPTEMLDKIFNPFVTSRDEGTGLGLATAWRIVEDHRGRLEVENLPGGSGVAFRVWLRDGTQVQPSSAGLRSTDH